MTMNLQPKIDQLKEAMKTPMGKITLVLFLVVTGLIILQNYWHQVYTEKMELIYGKQKNIANHISLNVHLLNSLQSFMMPPNDILIYAANRPESLKNEKSHFEALKTERQNLLNTKNALFAFKEKNHLLLNGYFDEKIYSHFDPLLSKTEKTFKIAEKYWETGDRSLYRKGIQLMEEIDEEVNTYISVVKDHSSGLLREYEEINHQETIGREQNNISRKRVMFLVLVLLSFVGVVYLVKVGKHEKLKQVLEKKHDELSEAYDDTELLIEEVMEKNKLLQDLAIKDSLTGLYNRRHFFDLLEKEIYRLDRYEGLSLCLMMVDIDFFKKINDTYGHQVGDEVIKAVVAVIQDKDRKIDVAGRYGGEEFIVFLPETDSEGALIKAERQRKEVEGLSLEIDGNAISVTISIGLTKFQKGMTSNQLTAKADSALYKAKHEGRNQVQFLE